MNLTQNLYPKPSPGNSNPKTRTTLKTPIPKHDTIYIYIISTVNGINQVLPLVVGVIRIIFVGIRSLSTMVRWGGWVLLEGKTRQTIRHIGHHRTRTRTKDQGPRTTKGQLSKTKNQGSKTEEQKPTTKNHGSRTKDYNQYQDLGWSSRGFLSSPWFRNCGRACLDCLCFIYIKREGKG